MGDNNIKYLFMITSLINVNPGYCSVFTSEERYEQTLNTIQSIRNKVPNAKIVVLEASFGDKKIIFDDVIMYYVDNSQICYHKSIGEATILKNFLNSTVYKSLIRDENYIVCKISGRYYLDDNFNIQNFDNNKINCRLIDTQNDPNNKDYDINKIIINPDICGVTSLFGFPSTMTEYINERLQYVIEHISYFGNDIEHILFKNISMDKINNIPIIGISGFITSGIFLSY